MVYLVFPIHILYYFRARITIGRYKINGNETSERFWIRL
nr:MAG TPA: hypothetical protein [Caudoviricetes sp.]